MSRRLPFATDGSCGGGGVVAADGGLKLILSSLHFKNEEGFAKAAVAAIASLAEIALATTLLSFVDVRRRFPHLGTRVSGVSAEIFLFRRLITSGQDSTGITSSSCSGGLSLTSKFFSVFNVILGEADLRGKGVTHLTGIGETGDVWILLPISGLQLRCAVKLGF